MAVSLSDREYRLFREWLTEEFGLCFGPERRDILRSRLEPHRAQLGFDTFEQLYFHLKFHPEREKERETLLTFLTNNESYFFRETPQLDLLRSEALPELACRLQREGRGEVRILSAACAAGEEPYTLAMIAREAGVLPRSLRLAITGLDVDVRALERARQARYGRNAFRRLDEAVRQKHFHEVEEGVWEVNPEIREVVRFQQGNLVKGDWVRRLPKQDIVFCRNVLIYFDDANIRRTADHLYELLTPGGSLFLGHAETLSRFPTRFQAERREGAIFYRRPERGHA